ncbi:hypothetical protein HK105_200815 [Polyrhizophydium stewartii]|uniref:G-protein coupled receptors family 3 profile domain-containing protein n=1 Tax=Polyrhizophydium stewartii TaxID=2732419 RepID=A0ABR4NK43_9FUNG
MAANITNTDPSILPDVTVLVDEIEMPQFEASPAQVYDLSVDLCDSSRYVTFVGYMTSQTTLALSSVCPDIPQTTIGAAIPQLSDKRLYKLFYRFVETISQDINILASMFRFFGWKKTGFMTSLAYEYAGLVFTQIFQQQGISVLAKVRLPSYDPTISQLYYPQVRSEFEFLKSTRLRIFVLFATTDENTDILLAANRTGLVGRDYYWCFYNSISFTPDQQDRWDTPADPSIFKGIVFPWFSINQSFDTVYSAAWLANFTAFVADSIARDSALYPYMNLGETDTTAQDYPQNLFYDDPGNNQAPSFCSMSGFDIAHGLLRTFEDLIVRNSATGMQLADRSLLRRLALKDILASLASEPSITGLTQFTDQGDPLADPFQLLQFSGKTLNDIGSPIANVPDNRPFLQFPVDSDPDQFDFVDLATTGTKAVLGVVLVSLIAHVAVICVLVWNAERQFGLAVIHLDVLTLVGKIRPLGCLLRSWPLTLGLSIVLCAAIQKNVILLDIFSPVLNMWASPIQRVNRIVLDIITAPLTLVTLVLLCIQAAVAPLQCVETYIESINTTRYLCAGSKLTGALQTLVDMWLALLSSGVVALFILNRNLPEAFNDTRELAVSFAIMGLMIGVYNIPGSDERTMQAQLFLEIGCLLCGSWVILVVSILQQLRRASILLQLRRKTVRSQSRRSSVASETQVGDSDKDQDTARPRLSLSLPLSSSPRKSTTDKPSRLDMARESVGRRKDDKAREFDVKTAAATQTVQVERARHKMFITLRVRVIVGRTLPQWRLATVMLLPYPLGFVRLALKEPAKIEHLPLRAIQAVTTRGDDAEFGSRVCEMEFVGRKLQLFFESSAAAQVWADAASRLTLACNRHSTAIEKELVVTGIAAKRREKKK